jgi:shikimate kinase
MSIRPPVVFIGPMAAGKTKVGRRVARLLGTEFIDTDKVVADQNGPIPAIFAEHGESYFRVLERAAVVSALGSDRVVSFGGGAVLDPATQADLADHRVAYLSVNAEAVAFRIDDTSRPLVQSGGVAEWERIYAVRRPLYESLADFEIDTSTGAFDAVSEEVVAWLAT